MRQRSRLLGLMLTAALLLPACTKAPPQVPTPPAKTAPSQNQELVDPFNQALRALRAMNEAGAKKEISAAEAQFRLFRTQWAPIQAKLKAIDPKLATNIEDGAIETDHEFAKPPAQVRPAELAEEAVKLSRLLAKAAEALTVTIDTSLVAPPTAVLLPFNKEQRITITLSDHKIEPNLIRIEQHTKVTFVVTNKGKEIHEFALDYYGVELEGLKPGETKELTLVLPDSGDFEVACHIPGHFEVGMFGKLQVAPTPLQKQ